MNITSGINNIKLKKFNGKDNKKIVSSQENNIKKETSPRGTKISPLYAHPIKNKNTEYLINKTPDMKSHINTGFNETFYFQNNNNNMLTKILLADKRERGNNTIYKNNIPFELKISSDKNNNINYSNNSYYLDNKSKKSKQITKLKNNEMSQFNYQVKNMINNNNNNKITKKIPQDNMRNKTEGIIISKKSLDYKKNNNEHLTKNYINYFIRKDNDNLKKTKQNENKINNINNKINKNTNNNINNDVGNNNISKIIFNNTVKKSVIETKSSGSNIKSVLSDEDIENIFLLNNVNNKYNRMSLFDSINDLKDNEIENYNYKLLYIINDEQNYLYKSKKFSNSFDYDNIIKNNLNNKISLSQKILKLPEREWFYELKTISDELKEKRETINIDNNFNNYLKKLISIYEHFYWLINSISVYYNIMFQNNQNFDSLFFDEINLPGIDSPLWKRGFKWKGLYINTIPENCSKHIVHEVKSLNYFFFDYLQIIGKYKERKENQLSSNIIFPLIGYSIVNGMVIYVSVLINPDKSFNNNPNFVNKFIEEIIHHNNGYVDFYLNNNSKNTNSNTNFSKIEENEHSHKKENMYELLGQLEKKLYIDDLLKSRLFLNLCEFHFIPLYGDKFLFINLYNLIPNLFEIKFSDYKKINFFSILNNKKFYDTLLYNKKTKTYSNNNNQVYKTPKAILEKYRINITQPIKIKDIIINKVHFRILYEKYENIHKNYMTRTFVDNLLNHYKNNSFEEEDNNKVKYIGDHYVIIYDLIQPIKLEYSLIKNIKNNKEIINNENHNNRYPFFIQTNYISYFLEWCKALNKNSYNIKTYSELKQSMKKFGISSHLKFFSLVNIDNDDITDIIKISLLVKLIKYIFHRHDNHINYNNKTKYLFENERIGHIFFIIKCFLYTSEISQNERNKFEKLFEDLVFYINVIFFKLKLIDDYLSLGLLNEKNISEINIACAKKNLILKEEMDSLAKKISGFDSTKDFLKQIIFTARKKPFLFLSELELKLNFVIDPFIKFKSSLSIESMSKKLKLDHISLDNYFNVYSYVNSDEISGLILSKLIYNDDEKNNISDNDDSIISNEESIHYFEGDSYKKNAIIKPNILNTKLNLKNNYNHPFVIEETDDFSETKSDNNIQQYNFQKKFGPTKKSSLPPSPMKRNSRFLERENSLIKWNNIKDYIFIRLPPMCYKMNFIYEESQENKNNFSDNNYLNNNYKISDSKIFKDFFLKIEYIFNNLNSCSGKIEQTLLRSLFYIFIINFFIEKNNKECQKNIKKIKEIYSKGNYLLSFADLAIINLFQGLSCEKYVQSEESYSKSVMLFLMLYGDPRGRNNDSHALMQLPLWKIARKTLKLEREQPSTNQYFLELYKSLEYFEKEKGHLNFQNNITYFDYEKNILKNIKNIFAINNINLNKQQQLENYSDNTSTIINNYLDKNIFLSKKIFSNEILDYYRIKNFEFLSIEENSKNVQKKIYSKEFIIYLIKQFQSILVGKHKIYDEKYINEKISENLFNINEEEIKINFYKDNNQKTYNKSSINIKAEAQSQNEMEFSPTQLIDAFHQRKNIFEIFSFGKDNNEKNNINNKLNNSLSSKKSDIKSQNTEVITKIKKGSRPSFTINKNKKNNNIFSHYIYVELLDKLSYKKNSPSGIVISFGNNTHNETSHDDYKAIKYPLLIYKLKNIKVKKIYSGWEHNIIISDTNEIYSFGNNNNLQCGVPSNREKENIRIKNPINVSELSGIKAISAACGNEHTLILDQKNDVYSFGNNEDGVLGIDNNKLKTHKFIKINFGKYNKRIKSISAGTVHNIALTDDGKIFSWGSAQGGQLGLSEEYITQPQFKDYYISTPTLVPMKLNINNKNSSTNKNINTNEDMKIIKISCGEAHSIVLNDKKEVYSWGFGSNGQLGLGFCEDSFELGTGLSRSRIFTPKKIKTFENFENKVLINDIQCGKTFSMFIDTNGGLYSCGVNDLKQLGIPESPPRNHLKNKDCQCKDFVIPTKLDYFLNMKVEKISCGEAHCVAIVKENHSNERIIWSWGNNRYGQLGLGDRINFSLPKPITFLFEYKENKFESVSCGGFHSLCLIQYNEDLSWIEDDFKKNICQIINDIGII